MEKIYDTIIIGGGPAGAAAAVYAGRKQMKTLLITESFGGQSIVSTDIENWIGDSKISGFDLAQKLEKHARDQNSVEFSIPEKAVSIKEASCGFELKTDKSAYLTRTIIVVSGGRHRQLGIPGEERFNGRGVAYCSTCDAPFYRDKTAVVIGGGNSGLEAVIDLEPYAKKIYMLLNMDKPTGDPKTWEEVKKIKKFELVTCTSIEEIMGDQKVTGVKYIDRKKGSAKVLTTDGVFVEIGTVPNSEFIKDMVKTNKFGEIIVDARTGATSHPKIFAAGDVTDDIYKQNNIAVGDAVRAALSAYYCNMEIKKRSKAEDCKLTEGMAKK